MLKRSGSDCRLVSEALAAQEGAAVPKAAPQAVQQRLSAACALRSSRVPEVAGSKNSSAASVGL